METYKFKTYSDLFSHISLLKNKTFLNYLDNGEYKNISAAEFKNKVICLSLALKDMGIKRGDTIAIFADSSPFWLIFDFAIHQIGAVSVPIFANISSENLNFELHDAKIKYMFIDNENRIKDIKKQNLIFISHGFCRKADNFFNFDEILILGKQICETHGFEFHQAKEDEIFSIIYTSGNTGTPKGVMLSHKNIISQLHDINSLIDLKHSEVVLSLLPLAHIFERTVMSYYLSRGVSIYFVDEITNTAPLLKVVKPTIMTAVPRLLEKIFNKIKLNISNKPFIGKTIASFAFSYALKEDLNKNSFLFKLFDKIVYSKFREIFGSRLNKLISGGAPLRKEISTFFNNVGVSTYQGYGLTEFSPVISTNYPNNNKIGSCGKVMPSANIKIAKDGELLTKGPSLMLGYLNQKELTQESIDNAGWLHTGDLASIDKEGYLYIKSRKKEIFKTSTGEYVAAVKIEQELSKNKYIEFAVVIAQNRQYTTALLFVDKDKFNDSKIINKDLTIEEYYNKSEITQDLEKHINTVNSKLNNWEKIIKFKIITNEISIETGELTPSMKICRGKIEEKYENFIDIMYQGESS